MKITETMVDSAAEAIEECMANDGWQMWGVRQPQLKKYVRTAARKALEKALAFARDDAARTPGQRGSDT